MTALSIPTPGARALTEAAARRSATKLASPDCILCGGKGWTMRRVEIPFIGGVEAVPCACAQIAHRHHLATNIEE